MKIISWIYILFWGDLVTLPLSGGGSIGLSALVLILIPAGIFFTVRIKCLPVRLLDEYMVMRKAEKKLI